jgi:tripartite-type tricarboxylate transporter receptor subunit TctC
MAVLAQPVAAQPVDFKGKTVTVIIPSSPGGGTDAVGRMIANRQDQTAKNNEQNDQQQNLTCSAGQGGTPRPLQH